MGLTTSRGTEGLYREQQDSPIKIQTEMGLQFVSDSDEISLLDKERC